MLAALKTLTKNGKFYVSVLDITYTITTTKDVDEENKNIPLSQLLPLSTV